MPPTGLSVRERLAAEFAERFAIDHLAMDDELWGRLHDAFAEAELADLTDLLRHVPRHGADPGRGRGAGPRRAHPRLSAALARCDGGSRRLGHPCSVAGVQSAGQLSWGSPAANASTSWCATSSWYCTGGDFMK